MASSQPTRQKEQSASQRPELNSELSPSHRRSFSFSSLRIKRRHNSQEEGGPGQRRGLRLFSSARESRKKESDQDGGAAPLQSQSQAQVQRTGEQPRGNLISDVDGKHNQNSADDEGQHRGALKRFSAMWSSFRRGRRDRKDSGSVEPPAPVLEGDASRQPRYVSGQYFFEYLVVVSLQKAKGSSSSYEPQITYQFPKRDGMAKYQKEEEEKTLKAITLFCFPEGISWAPLTEYHSETFSFVLTEIDGSRRNGYCRRLLPGGKGARPPEAYCIISSLACFGLFSKIFDEVEKRRQISMAMIYPFMQKLREAPFPAPGNTVEINSFIPESGTEASSREATSSPT